MILTILTILAVYVLVTSIFGLAKDLVRLVIFLIPIVGGIVVMWFVIACLLYPLTCVGLIDLDEYQTNTEQEIITTQDHNQNQNQGQGQNQGQNTVHQDITPFPQWTKEKLEQYIITSETIGCDIEQLPQEAQNLVKANHKMIQTVIRELEELHSVLHKLPESYQEDIEILNKFRNKYCNNPQ